MRALVEGTLFIETETSDFESEIRKKTVTESLTGISLVLERLGPNENS